MLRLGFFALSVLLNLELFMFFGLSMYYKIAKSKWCFNEYFDFNPIPFFKALAIALLWLCLWVGWCMSRQRQMCAMCDGIRNFSCGGNFFCFFSEASAIQIGVGRCWLLSKFSFFVCQFNVSTVAIGFPVTFYLRNYQLKTFVNEMCLNW